MGTGPGSVFPKRKPILNLLREHLRRRDILPILFDFEKPASRDLLETVSMLAHMSKLVLGDLTDASFVKLEVPHIVRRCAPRAAHHFGKSK
jgi:hypothetical protein